MDDQKKLALLKSLRLLEHIPEDQQAALAKFLTPETYPDGAVVFEEGSKGDSLYFLASGRVHIMKKVLLSGGAQAYKDLAVLGVGDCFGEMALFDDAPRSARAVASDEATLLRLERAQLNKWLESNPTLAIGFFTELVHMLGRRLRHSSNELALLFDLSAWLLDPVADGSELMQKALGHIVPHLEGSWSAGAYLHNAFNDETELVAAVGDFAASKSPAPAADQGYAWIDPTTFLAPLRSKLGLRGYLVFTASAPLEGAEKAEVSRTLITAAHLIFSALENVSFRAEESYRARLASSRGVWALTPLAGGPTLRAAEHRLGE